MDWKVLVSTFGLLFLAELGDKTQLSVITMTARTGKPVLVFLGAVAALAVVTLLGVLFGGTLAQFVSPRYLRTGAALSFIAIGLLILSGRF